MQTLFHTATFFVLSLSLSSPLFADGAAAVQKQGFAQSLTVMIIGAFLFYWMIIRPESTKRRALEEARQSMKKGDSVIAMGIIGTVVRSSEEKVVLKMHGGSEIAVKPYMITEVQTDSSE